RTGGRAANGRGHGAAGMGRACSVRLRRLRSGPAVAGLSAEGKGLSVVFPAEGREGDPAPAGDLRRLPALPARHREPARRHGQMRDRPRPRPLADEAPPLRGLGGAIMTALPIPAAAAQLGVSTPTLKRWLRQGAPVARRGRRGRGCRTLIDPEAIRAWRRAQDADHAQVEAVLRALAGRIPELLADAAEEA